MLELRNIVKVYQGGTVNETCLFNDFSLSIPERQFVCVVGSNGSGKTSVPVTYRNRLPKSPIPWSSSY